MPHILKLNNSIFNCALTGEGKKIKLDTVIWNIKFAHSGIGAKFVKVFLDVDCGNNLVSTFLTVISILSWQ